MHYKYILYSTPQSYPGHLRFDGTLRQKGTGLAKPPRISIQSLSETRQADAKTGRTSRGSPPRALAGGTGGTSGTSAGADRRRSSSASTLSKLWLGWRPIESIAGPRLCPNAFVSMDQLETQVSDLRSFLSQAPLAPEEVVSPRDVAYSPAGPLRASSHHSSLSALGDNSAPQPSSPVDSRVSTTGAAKRRADDGDGEAVAKQQRSKRNRVGRCLSGYALLGSRVASARLLTLVRPAVYIDCLVCTVHTCAHTPTRSQNTHRCNGTCCCPDRIAFSRTPADPPSSLEGHSFL